MSAPNIIPQEHNSLGRLLFSQKIQPIPEERPKSNHGFLSRLTFSWLDPLLRLGYDRVLVVNDIPYLPKRNSVKSKIEDWRRFSERHKQRNFAEVLGIFYALRWRFLACIVSTVIADGARAGQAALSRSLIKEAERLTIHPRHDHGRGAGLAVGNTALSLLMFASLSLSQYLQEFMSEEGKTLIVAAIHDKMIRLSPQQRHDFTAAKMLSLGGPDAERFSMALMFITELIIFPFYLAGILGVLIYNLGAIALAGLGLILVGVVVNYGVSVLTAKIRQKSMPYQDKRISLSRETIKNMSIIKFYGWQESFLKRISKYRRVEARYIQLLGFMRAVVISTVISSPDFAGALTFSVRIIIGRGIQAYNAFPSLSLFLQLSPVIATLGMAMNALADAWIVAKRLNEVFKLPETPSYIQNLQTDDPDLIFGISDASFGWDVKQEASAIDTDLPNNDNINATTKVNVHEKQEDTNDNEGEVVAKVLLSGINVSIRSGTLVLVLGRVGSGKTTFLSTFLGSIPLKQGTVALKEGTSVSSVLSQWSANATVRSNILFGEAWDPKKYAEVIRICDLTPDIELFSKGDLTQVGENGVTLSGGQRARLALARCLYADRQIIVLDDVLSAMDAKVGNFISRELTTLVRTKGKTVVLATNNLNQVGEADSIIQLDGNGHASQILPQKYVPRSHPEAENTPDVLERNASEQERENLRAQANACRDREMLSIEITEALPYERQLQEDIVADRMEDSVRAVSASSDKEYAKDDEITPEEERAVGSVNFKVILNYLQLNTAQGIIGLTGIILFLLVLGGSDALPTVFMNWWTSDRFHKSQGFNIGMYCLILGCKFIFYLGFAIALTIVFTNASSRLHTKALTGVYRAPISFFQRNPLGRVMTRFSDDLSRLDTLLPTFGRQFLVMLVESVALAVTVFVYVPWSILCIIPIMTLSLAFFAFYRTASRELNRLVQLEESRLLSTMSEDAEGQEVIIAYGKGDLAREVLENRIDTKLAVEMCNIGSHFWMALRASVACEILALVAIFLAVFQVMGLTGPDTGMLLSVLPSFISMVATIFPIFAMFENQLNSTERLEEYATGIEEEGSDLPTGNKDSNLRNWTTSDGKISFENVSLRYREGLPLSLNDLSFTIRGGSRLGVCGRTGAGKSTIINALFRVVEIESGSIMIDNQNIASLPLQALRSSLAIIPQQPVLFQGTVRSNLDPFGEHTDKDMWYALKSSGLDSANAKFHLDGEVDSEGRNFSLGERQMLTLARALLRNSKILILDEATAAVDEETDMSIQRTIKTAFGHCTVLCIAHRLQTIMDYDEILVLGSGGKMLEMGPPQELLKRHGVFFEMAKEAKIISD